MQIIPRVVGRRLTRDQQLEINQGVAVSRTYKKRRHLNAALALGSGAPGAQPFDAAGYRSWLKVWEAELGALPEQQLIEIQTGARAFFQGRPMGEDWRKIVGFLQCVRAQLKQPYVVERRSPYASGARPSGGW